MRSLTNEEIGKLAAPKAVRKIAVENFLGSLYEPAGYAGSIRNLYEDARVYKWNEATVNAIRKGINLAFGW